MVNVGSVLFMFVALFFSDLESVQGAWRSLTPAGSAVWKDSGKTWTAFVKPNDGSLFHFGPARLWTSPVDSDHYEITSKVLTAKTASGDCGHIFKYKVGSTRTLRNITKAWGYFLWNRQLMYITSNVKENTPKINYKYTANTWYDLKTIVKGAVVEIYINNKLVKQVKMEGEGATSKTNNFVGLWCHSSTDDTGSDFKVQILSFSMKSKQVNCSSNHMQVTIPKSSLPFVLAKDLRLNDPSCGATEDDINFYLKTAFDRCGTKSNSTNEIITYSNQVLGKPLANNTVISRIRDIEVKFSCSYPRTKILGSSNVQPNNSKFAATFYSHGKFHFSLKLFPSSKFSVPYSKYPISVHLRQLVYIEVSVRSIRNELSISTQHCYATPSSNGESSKHWLIKDSCPMDPTLKALASPRKNVQRFSVQAFRFIGNYKYFYLHCHVIACNGNDVNSKCSRDCIKGGLGKRDVNEKPFFRLIQGPIAVRRPKMEDVELQDDPWSLFPSN